MNFNLLARTGIMSAVLTLCMLYVWTWTDAGGSYHDLLNLALLFCGFIIWYNMYDYMDRYEHGPKELRSEN